jgi:serine/threonine protein kinase
MRSQQVRDTIRQERMDAHAPADDDTLAQSGERPVSTDLVAALDVRPSGRYTYAATLGEGGMGEVLLCEDRRIHRQVAIKVMHKRRAANPGDRERFLREVSAQGRLEHPAIVPVYDAAVDEAGSPYFIMRRVRGPTLEQILFGLRLKDDIYEREHSPHSLLSAFGRVCLAVHYAHENGVVHCDLKPANVMLGSYGEVYVLDWGLAARVGEAGDPNSIYGSPGYMAPEQIRSEPPSPAADVYALGAILYELLSLRPMIECAEPFECFRMALMGHVDPPSQRAPERDVPPELEAIWAKATALEPAARHPSARALHDAIARYLAGDRDLVLRRTLSQERVDAASAAIERSRHGPADDATARSEAMGAIGQALALDPGNAEALRALAALLAEPMREMPREARDEMHAAERVAGRERSRVGAIAFLAWFAFVPLFFVNGVRSVPALILMSAAWLAAAFVQVHAWRRPRKDGYAPTLGPVLGAVAVATSSAMMGPLVLTPILATLFALAFSLGMRPSRRFVPLVAGCLSILVPELLQLAGILPRSYAYQNGGIVILPLVVNLSRFGHWIFLVACLVCVLVAWYYGVRVRANLNDVQRRVYAHSWQLRQLLPATARVSGAKTTR